MKPLLHKKNIHIKGLAHNALVSKGVSVLQKQNYIRFDQFTLILIFLSLCFIVVIGGYIWTTTSLQKRNYTISDIQQQISVARKTSVKLQIELSEKRNLSRILSKGSSAYHEVGKVQYIPRPNTSPFDLFNE